MTDHLSASLVSRLALDAEPSRIVSIDEHVIFLSLANQACRAVRESSPGQLTILVDSHTAGNCPHLRDICRDATQAHVLGPIPDGWEFAKALDLPEYAGKDHFLLLLAPDFAIGLWGTADMKIGPRLGAFSGAWSCDVELVHDAASKMLAGDRLVVPDLSSGVPTSLLTIAQSLMATQSSELVERQRHMALDRADLFSVLQILKAISSNRRSHDILYVFVEQIARVVESDRCSVVRIWGDAGVGHVLASHEDESVADHAIQLSRYPELSESFRTGDKVVITDAANDELTKAVSGELSGAGIHSLLVIPICVRDPNVGTLLLRAARKEGVFTLREISFFEIVAGAASNALERAQLFESIQEANERLERLAITDGLTGVFNRRHFREQLDHEVERALRYELPMGCLMIDVDNFKGINDNYGHLVGDNVLKEVSDRTSACVRKTDFLARYGGEEFVVLMPQTDESGAMVQAERIVESVSSNPFHFLPADLAVTVSVGVSVVKAGEKTTSEALLHAADQALYEAKRNGKNQFVFAKEST